MANPLVNELIIGTGQKDRWNVTNPRYEKRFLDFYLNSRLASLLNLAFGTNFPVSGRTDLVAALLQYPKQDPHSCSGANRCSDLLRLDLHVDPMLPHAQHRLGLLGGDKAGFPNGRRPNDDVTDIALRVVAGALLGPVPNLGDGVNFNIGAPGTNVTGNNVIDHKVRLKRLHVSMFFYHHLSHRMAAVLIFCFSTIVSADPFVPKSESEVLERLPKLGDYSTRELRHLRIRLAEDPNNLELAVSLAARYLEMGRAEGDPRYSGYA
jgi:hypothetical protein